MEIVSVECKFAADGRIRVKRVERNGRWLTVEQGRQWQDDNGRHVLIMLNGQARRLTLSPELRWSLAADTRPAAL